MAYVLFAPGRVRVYRLSSAYGGRERSWMNPMWMILATLAAVALLAAVFAVQQIAARRRAARGPLPPLCAADEHVAHPQPVQLLSRDSLVNPNRALNVHAWDNTPDSGSLMDLDGVPEPAADPYVIDRDFLAHRGRPGAGPQG